MAEELRIDLDETEFLVYAIGSYQIRASVLSGANVTYDSHFLAVFRALDQLAAEGVHPCGRYF